MKAEGSERRIESRLLVAMMLFTLALTFKISSLAFAGLGWGVALFELFSLKSPRLRERQLIVAAVLLSAALAIPWLIRGVILSGYPLFPSSVFAVNVDWRVPRVATDMLAQFNRSWARIPHAGFEETGGIRWVGRWFAGAIGNRVDFIAPLFVSLVGFVFLLRRGVLKDLFWLKLLLPSLGGLAFWFSLAPAFRFGEAAIWTTAACLGAAALQQLLPPTSLRGRQVVLFGLLAPRRLVQLPTNHLEGILPPIARRARVSTAASGADDALRAELRTHRRCAYRDESVLGRHHSLLSVFRRQLATP